MMQKVEVFGEVPLARFGHTITQGNLCPPNFIVVSKSKVVLFGGATGDTGKYIITGDTYTLDLISFKWTKLEGTYFSFSMFDRIWHCTFSTCGSWQLLCGPAPNGCLRRCYRW